MDELRWLLVTLKRARTNQEQQNQAWVMLILNSGLKTSQIISMTVGNARAVVTGSPVRLPGGELIQFTDEAAHWLKVLLDLREWDEAHRDDDPLLMSRLNGGLTNRALQLRLDALAKDNVDSINRRRITVNALVATHRAAMLARTYSYLQSYDTK